MDQLKAALFPGGVANPSSSYVCSQSIFKCDLLFNADPSVTILFFSKFRLSSSVSSSQILLMVAEIQHQIVPAEKIRCHWDKRVSMSWAPDTTKTQLGSTPGFMLPYRQTGMCPATPRRSSQYLPWKTWWVLCCPSNMIMVCQYAQVNEPSTKWLINNRGSPGQCSGTTKMKRRLLSGSDMRFLPLDSHIRDNNYIICFYDRNEWKHNLNP